ncbi:MAG: hypothetical protein M1818_003243 [Claussenomyces sp. TS43310]|nr:MAG: hypothetical protein M1818_003243 [Claussenomyces sp. TS43310]
MTKVFCKQKISRAIRHVVFEAEQWNLLYLVELLQDPDSTWRSSPEDTNKTAHFNKPTNTEALESPPRIRIRVPRLITPAPANSTLTGAFLAENVLQDPDGSWNTQDLVLPQPPQRKLKRKLEDLDFFPITKAPATPSGNKPISASSVFATPTKTVARHRGNGGGGGHKRYHGSLQDDKPPPYGRPPVWADKRQQLCETLPYYRAYQSGAYVQDGTARAFMVDKEVGPRDKLNEEILIARVGGGRTLDTGTGQMVHSIDQERSPFAMGFSRARNFGLPVAVIAGQGNRLSPSKLPHYYNVLDWFQVTDVWCELSGGFKCWMVRLEKMALDKKSWWASRISSPINPDREYSSIRTIQRQCSICQVISKEIYNAGWTCLNPRCRIYFRFDNQPDGIADDKLLDYNSAFLEERTPLHLHDPPSEPLDPPLLTDEDVERTGGFGIETKFKAGIVCPRCKGCSRRIEWSRWKCEHGCSFTHAVQQKVVPVTQAISRSLDTGREQCDMGFGIGFSQKTLGLYDVYEYTIPGLEGDGNPAGFIRHFKANGIINRQVDGPNDLFRLMQERDFGLKRHPARQAGSTGEILTSHWAANWGAPYKYGVSVLSKGFDEAPPVIIKALKRLTWAGNQAVSDNLESFHPFNELLSIGYFEDTSIGYHDDGEKELGPTVATLSLGATALMSFRPKAKYPLGKRSKNHRGTKPDVMRIILDHGDIIVMHGSGIQKLYEHAVTPQGKLRFALTCRYVRPELMANDAERRDAVIKGSLPADHAQYNYDGDVACRPDVVEAEPQPGEIGGIDGIGGDRGDRAERLNELKAMILAGDISSRELSDLRKVVLRGSNTKDKDSIQVPIVTKASDTSAVCPTFSESALNFSTTALVQADVSCHPTDAIMQGLVTVTTS